MDTGQGQVEVEYRGVKYPVNEAIRDIDVRLMTTQSQLYEKASIDTVDNGAAILKADIMTEVKSNMASTQYVQEMLEKQVDITNKLIEELVNEVKDLREEGQRSQEQIDELTKRVQELEQENKIFRDINKNVREDQIERIINQPSIQPYDPNRYTPNIGVWTCSSSGENGPSCFEAVGLEQKKKRMVQNKKRSKVAAAAK